MLSIIIPTLNESERLPLLLSDLNTFNIEYEIIIIDGCSKDLTCLIAQLGGAKVIKTSEPNRGKQLQIGANIARGDWFLFLHADCRMSKTSDKIIEQTILDPINKSFAWFFDFRVSRKGITWLILEIIVAMRSNLLQRPYGDQGLLINKNLYFKIGGFKPIPIMEDIDLIIRISNKTKLRSLGIELITSSRKFRDGNIISNGIRNAFLRSEWKKGKDLQEIRGKYYFKK